MLAQHKNADITMALRHVPLIKSLWKSADRG